MGSGFAILFHLLLVSQCLYGITSREINRRQSNGKEHINEEHHQKKMNMNMHMHDLVSSNMIHMDPDLNVFFKINDLKLGTRMPIYFPVKDTSISPVLLPREEADSIPFSLSKLPNLLKLFSFPIGSRQAKAMEDTLRHCEHEPLLGETKFCATSLESMLDFARAIHGSNTKLKVLTTNHITEPSTLLQNYTVIERPKEILTPRIVACHDLPYPYAVLYCHSEESKNKLLMVSLAGDDGGRVEALAMCHVDTSQWDPDHLAFRVLKTKPGLSPVCHFFPADSLIWIPSSSIVK